MKPLNLVALLLFLAGVVWVLTLSELSVRKIQQTYYATISPFLKVGSTLELSAREFLKEVENSEDLEMRLEGIELEFGKLRSIESQLRELEVENNELRAALDFEKRTRFEVTAARVIKRQPATWWRSATINRGEDAKIGPQVPVLASGGLAGKIDWVGKSTATVILLTDESCQVSVQVAGTAEVGIVSGQRGDYGNTPLLRLRYLTKDAQIRPGMKVITTGRGGLFQPNILVGTVESFEPGAFDGEALVKPSVDFQKLSIVFVTSKSEKAEGQ